MRRTTRAERSSASTRSRRKSSKHSACRQPSRFDNQQLIAAQRRLLESFIQMIASAIDAKSPYTGGHRERVPILTEMLAGAVCDTKTGPFADFDLDREEWYELHIAAWLHDCGKVTTPVHVMDKATKLESIRDGIETVRARFEAKKREIQLDHALAGGAIDDEALTARIEALDDDLAEPKPATSGASSWMRRPRIASGASAPSAGAVATASEPCSPMRKSRICASSAGR